MRALTVLAIALLGCNETEIRGKQPDLGDVAPNILVYPPELNFGDQPVGTQLALDLTITNDGNAVLDITNLLLGPAPVFDYIQDIPDFGLEPEESTIVQVTYVATNVVDLSSLTIVSSDADTPEVEVPLSGGALLPHLLIEPDPYAFGAITRTCDDVGQLTLTNVGKDDLVIDGVVVSGAAFALDDTEAMPLTLPPGGDTWVDVRFSPSIVEFYKGELQVSSNDPRGIQAAALEGAGERLPTQTDIFEQILTDWTLADIFFYVDQSSSMLDDQETLAENWDLFTAFLLAGGLDYQVMVSTKDNGCHNGTIITPSTPNPSQAFEDAVVSAAYGIWTEAGLTIALNAFEQVGLGQCNEGFLRPYVNPILVLISDEPEQSANTWDWYVQRLLQIAPAARIDAVVTIVPCGYGAEGTGYFEAAQATGGSVLDICSDDWAEKFATIVQVEQPLDTFVLTEEPVVETIEVLVNGYESYDWAYDAEINAIVFLDFALPPPAAIIEVSYEIEAECDDIGGTTG
jgi:hypothetical protein